MKILEISRKYLNLKENFINATYLTTCVTNDILVKLDYRDSDLRQTKEDCVD